MTSRGAHFPGTVPGGRLIPVCHGESVQNRATRTMWHLPEATDSMHVPTICSLHSNERHCGALSGHSKSNMAERFGAKRLSDGVGAGTAVLNLLVMLQTELEQDEFDEDRRGGRD